MTDLNNNQGKQGWGGSRPGAGRPKGSSNKPRISDHITEDEIAALVATAKQKAEDGDTRMLSFLLEQIFGKAKQSMDVKLDPFGDNPVKELPDDELASIAYGSEEGVS